MAEDHYTNMDASPRIWGKLGYKRAKGFKAEAPDKKELQGQEDSQDRQVKKEPQGKADPQDKQVQELQGKGDSLTMKLPI
jgi:hypothetical protein